MVVQGWRKQCFDSVGFFGLENKGSFQMCYDTYVYKTNHFPKINIYY